MSRSTLLSPRFLRVWGKKKMWDSASSSLVQYDPKKDPQEKKYRGNRRARDILFFRNGGGF